MTEYYYSLQSTDTYGNQYNQGLFNQEYDFADFKERFNYLKNKTNETPFYYTCIKHNIAGRVTWIDGDDKYTSISNYK